MASEDLQGITNMICSIFFAAAPLSIFIRCYVRYVLDDFWWDDWLMLFGIVRFLSCRTPGSDLLFSESQVDPPRYRTPANKLYCTCLLGMVPDCELRLLRWPPFGHRHSSLVCLQFDDFD